MKLDIQDLLTDESFRNHILNSNLEEDDDWYNWKKESEENSVLYDQARSFIKTFYEPLPEGEFQAEAIDFKRKIGLTKVDQHDIIHLHDQEKEHRNKWLLRIAASIALIASIAFVVNTYISTSNPVVSDQVKARLIKKEASKGQKLTVTFQDGTRVKLNSESSIEYPEEFNGNVREVILSGEAYFDVAHFEDWPFIVKSKDVRTKVLGTSFNVSSYPEDCCVKVALVEGKVEVLVADQTPVELKPQKMATIESVSQNIRVVDFETQTVTAWKDNKIIFKRASFDEVQSKLERWYDVKFSYNKKPVFEGGYTGEFVDESLNTVLMGMSTGKFNYEIRGNKIFIN